MPVCLKIGHDHFTSDIFKHTRVDHLHAKRETRDSYERASSNNLRSIHAYIILNHICRVWFEIFFDMVNIYNKEQRKTFLTLLTKGLSP